ncbi:hypothetical protein BJ684DRAFT_21989 [Piptocephalis cylindrospora]|uniref:F-BAR domain-containing protein n=1 Tax=Piptocephalis cylindrospora TaxID=1907219 RepID=A0A4P9Y097_9FUNG|nr:hypothetical protein BJ684DRAFT_21989 [Piptocephalis cylindrospora]|eukprot:RKP11441.1 hypothetical protein BJ684DRAFT_21989 [Piptocephalis cylindrospora]
MRIVKMSYVGAFIDQRPKSALDTLSSRLRRAKHLNDELADYFRERANIEEAYARQLTKLSAKKNNPHGR